MNKLKETFQRQGCLGKAAMIAVPVFALIFLCGILSSIISPTSSKTKNTPTVQVASSPQAGAAAQPLPTYTPYPTSTPLPMAIGTPLPTATPGPTIPPTAVPTSIPTPAPETWEDMGVTRSKLTELQWSEWIKTLPEKRVHWDGVVSQVQGDGQVLVNLPYEALPRAWLQGLSKDVVVTLNKDQHIEFVATIKKVADVLGMVVYLTDVTLLQTTTSATAAPVQVQLYKVSDVVQVKDHTITLNSATIQADILKANFTIENKGKDEIAVSSLLSFDAKDTEGTKLESSIFDCGSSLDGKILAGDKLKGDICWKGLTTDKARIYYEANIFGSGAIVWEVSK